MPGRALLFVLLALVVGVLPVLSYSGTAQATVPGGFSDELVRDVDQPTALAFTPDGRLLISSKPGVLRVYEPGTATVQALDISAKTCANSERGLLGVAVDPNFEANRYIYLYYTFNKHGVCPAQEPGNPNNPVNRVSRFVLSDDNVATDERVLITNIPSPNGNHNGGDVRFGKDGYLYVSVGDGGCDYAQPSQCQSDNDASRDRHVLLGKVLRVTRAGAVPPGNPYTNPDNSDRCNATGRTQPGNNCRETFARGFRNPFRMAFDPDAAGTSFFVNDVGAARWEEIDRGRRGADYGWNLCEGRHDNPGRPGSTNCSRRPLTPPIHEYSHNTGCSSITGGAFVPNGVWPDPYDSSYLFGDFVCDKIFRLTPKSGGGFRRTEFGTDLGGVVALAFGPDGSETALFYTTFANGGEVRRIAHEG